MVYLTLLLTKYFTGTVTRIGGLSLDQIEKRIPSNVWKMLFGPRRGDYLQSGGIYQFKVDGEYHLFNPHTIYNFQQAVRKGDYKLFKEYTAELDKEALSTPTTLRSIWEFKSDRPKVDLSEVEPVETIVKTFQSWCHEFWFTF